jgi:hypothetical protein
MRHKLMIIMVLALTAKIILIFAVNKDLNMTSDEGGNYDLAYNHYKGNGYTRYDAAKNKFIPYAYHGSFTVFVYEFLIKNGIKKQIWVALVYILSCILFLLSIDYFYRLSLFFIKSERYALFSTVTYCFYPSVMFYIGPLFFYENLAVSLLIIILYKLLLAVRNGFTKADYFVIPIAVALSSLFRAQTIAIYATIFFIYAIIILAQRAYKLIPLLLFTISFMFIVQIPSLVKNKKMFGEYILSTQSGFELLQGHNPTARGSWMGDCDVPTSPLYKYVHSEIANINELNEWEDSKARKHLAIKWIIENPIGEITLCARKLAIYFLPKNFETLYTSNVLNPVNLLVHLFFLSFIIMQLYKREFIPDEMLLFSPIAGSIILSLVFFVGYRWRYYAEPFMIVFAWRFLFILFERLKMKGRNAPIAVAPL